MPHANRNENGLSKHMEQFCGADMAKHLRKAMRVMLAWSLPTLALNGRYSRRLHRRKPCFVKFDCGRDRLALRCFTMSPLHHWSQNRADCEQSRGFGLQPPHSPRRRIASPCYLRESWSLSPLAHAHTLRHTAYPGYGIGILVTSGLWHGALRMLVMPCWRCGNSKRREREGITVCVLPFVVGMGSAKRSGIMGEFA